MLRTIPILRAANRGERERRPIPEASRSRTIRVGSAARAGGGRGAALLLALALPLGALVTGSPAQGEEAKKEDSDRPLQTVAADALPTVQIDGVVWDQEVVGTTVYAVGQFTSARPAGAAPGESETPRTNALAYDITTGEMLDWSPQVDAQILEVEASPDGSTIYLAGEFTQVGGEATARVGAVDASSGERKELGLGANSVVEAMDVSPDGSTLYLGGAFTELNGKDRARAAAVDLASGSVTDFAPKIADFSVRSIAVAPDNSAVTLGGSFTSVDGQATPGLALMGVDGTLRELGLADVVSSGGQFSGAMNLSGDDRGFYAVFYSGEGNFEGMLRADWQGGQIDLMADCHGDSYDVQPAGDIVYVASHAHDCSMIGGFPETNEPRQHWHAPAFSATARGTVQPSPEPHYASHTGQPAASVQQFFPEFAPGTHTGMTQATWTVEASRDYLVYGGEFTSVNGKPQQGLVRFARRHVAPNQEGPTDPGEPGIKASVTDSGEVELRIPYRRDRDDATLTYALYRDDTEGKTLEDYQAKTAVWNSKQRRAYWETGEVVARDTVEPGSTHTYVVVVWDQWGAWTRSETITLTAGEAPEDDDADQQDDDAEDDAGKGAGAARGADGAQPPEGAPEGQQPAVDPQGDAPEGAQRQPAEAQR
ncbi:hypothetical protein ACSL103130_10585 [Actinomyces slackii]